MRIKRVDATPKELKIQVDKKLSEITQKEKREIAQKFKGAWAGGMYQGGTTTLWIRKI
jgi:hypothetical protein